MIKINQAITTVLNALGSSKEEKINYLGQYSHCHRFHHDLVLALLLPRLLKVEKLALHLENNRGTHYFEQMVHKAARREKPFDSQPPFEALTVFDHSQDTLNVRSTSFIASLLKLPSIQKISGAVESMWDDNDDLGVDKNLIELESSSSPLISLDLVAYRLSTAELYHMLRAPKALKNLFYKVCPPTYIQIPNIRQALGPQENCLENLALDCDEGSLEDGYVLGHLESFTSFNSLKTFKTVAVLLPTTDYGTGRHSFIDFFPPNLETLHLTHFQADFESLLEALEHLLGQDSSQQIPSLKYIILEEADLLDPTIDLRPARLMDILWKGTQEYAIERLRRMAAARGVFIDVIEREESTDEEASSEEWSLDESSANMFRGSILERYGTDESDESDESDGSDESNESIESIE